MDEQALLADLAKGDAKLLVIGGGVEDDARDRLRAASQRLDLLVLVANALAALTGKRARNLPLGKGKWA